MKYYRKHGLATESGFSHYIRIGSVEKHHFGSIHTESLYYPWEMPHNDEQFCALKCQDTRKRKAIRTSETYWAVLTRKETEQWVRDYLSEAQCQRFSQLVAKDQMP